MQIVSVGYLHEISKSIFWEKNRKKKKKKKKSSICRLLN